MVLLIDNFDSFSHVLADYLTQLGVQLHIVRNNTPLEELIHSPWEGLVLSPGPETPQKAGNLMQILGYYHDKLPVLGICLGHQAIGAYFGANVVKCAKPVHGKVHQVYRYAHHPILANIPVTFKVTRYHSLELQDLPPDFEVLFQTAENEVMAIAHKTLPLIGIQYHPEAYLTEFGLDILKNWAMLYLKPSFSHQICL
jgi:anthranilate synthase component II